MFSNKVGVYEIKAVDCLRIHRRSYFCRMYAYLEGNLTFKSPTKVYLDVGGVAYLIHISLNTFGKIESQERVRLYTYLHVKEDDLSLYGFYDEEEKNLFVQLISVSGIGPNTARIIVSSMSPNEVRTAILMDNDLAFKKVKGVGPKTAKRIILDLKDKIGKGEAGITLGQASGPLVEARDALVALGFQKSKVEKTLSVIQVDPGSGVEGLIKKALKQLT